MSFCKGKIDLSTVEKLRDDSSNYFELKKTISALLMSKGILGACCPADSLSASMMHAEWVAVDAVGDVGGYSCVLIHTGG